MHKKTKTPSLFFKITLLSILLCACTKADYELAGGERGSFSDWQGKWVFINYWATWCAPCYEEIPEFNAFLKAHPDVVVLGVNFDQPQGDALYSAITKMGVKFPVLTKDPNAALGFDTPAVLPATIILNPQGKVHVTLFGPQTQATLARVIGEK